MKRHGLLSLLVCFVAVVTTTRLFATEEIRRHVLFITADDLTVTDLKYANVVADFQAQLVDKLATLRDHDL